MGLRVLAGAQGLDRPVRWVHISELADPTPFLTGGELLLTHGAACDADGYVGRLAGHGVAGVGIAVGEDGIAAVAPGVLADAEAAGLPVIEIPDAVPFIAITERAARTIVNAQADLLARASDAHARLERVVLAEGGLDGITSELATLIGTGVAVLDAAGRTLAVAGGVAGVSEVLRLPVVRPGEGTPEAWLEADGPLSDLDRLVVQHAVTVVGLELLRRRVVAETEHRLAGDVLAALLAGELAGEDLERRLEPFGLAGSLTAVVVEAPSEDDARAVAAVLADAVRLHAPGGLAAASGRHACAFLRAPRTSPTDLKARNGGSDDHNATADARGGGAGAPGDGVAEAVRAHVAAALGQTVHAGVSRATAAVDARRAFHEARCALEATAGRNGGRPLLSTFDDLGSFRLLLTLQDGDALRLFCESILAPIEEADADYGGELLPSLAAFIEANGAWEKAARRLDCHRHTLRYRVKRIEELTGRSLDRAQDRTDFWLALRGRELVG